MSIVRQTDLSAATIDSAAALYSEAFNVRTFYVLRALWGDMPATEVDPIQLLQFKQFAYRAMSNHELYFSYLDGSQEPGAIMVLKPPIGDGKPPSEETPYDAEFDARIPPDVTARSEQLDMHRAAIKSSSWGAEDKLNYHISYLATAPAAQRRGLASRLIKMALDRARSEGREVSLTTHNAENAQFYARLGFKTRGYAEWNIGTTPFTWWCLTTDMAGKDDDSGGQ